jgi:hypothetical protein
MEDPRLRVGHEFLGDIGDGLRENIQRLFDIFSDRPLAPGVLEGAIVYTLNEAVNPYRIHCEYKDDPILATNLSGYGHAPEGPPTPRRPTAAFSNLPPLLSPKKWDGAPLIDESRIGWQPGFEGAVRGQKTIREMFDPLRSPTTKRQKRMRSSSGGKRRATRRRH